MGSSHSHTYLGSDCTSFQSNRNHAIVCWGNSISVEMAEFVESGEFSRWGMRYISGQKICIFDLEAHSNRNGVESVCLRFIDKADDNEAKVLLEITRDESGGLCCERSMHIPGPQLTTTKSNQNCLIETTTLSYGCSQRQGLLVVETRRNINYENAYMVTLAQYYVTQDLGLSVVAKICANKGDGSGVEVKGPYTHPGKDLRMVIVQTCRSREWTPTACPHCCPTLLRDLMGGVARVLRRFFNLDSSNQSSNTAGDPESRERNITGLVNSFGYTHGNLNNSIIKVKNLYIYGSFIALAIFFCCFCCNLIS